MSTPPVAWCSVCGCATWARVTSGVACIRPTCSGRWMLVSEPIPEWAADDAYAREIAVRRS